jgi:hypothetical protein
VKKESGESDACEICGTWAHATSDCIVLEGHLDDYLEPEIEPSDHEEDVERQIEAALERDLEASLEHALEAQLETAGGWRPGRRRPAAASRKLKIQVGVLGETIDESEQALANDPDVFVRDYKIVHVTRATRLQEEKSADVHLARGDGTFMTRKSVVADTPFIHIMELPTLRERLTGVADYEKIKDDDWVACWPSDPIVAGLICRKQWPRLRPIVGIIETPFMRPDGTICQTPGYDEATGFEYIPPRGYKFDRVPDNPTQEDAKRAYERVHKEIYSDFTFAPGHDSVPLAGMLTILTRPAIRGSIPIFLFDGNVAGVGKSLVTDTIAIVASGRCMPRMSYPHSEEEQEKLLAAYAIQGTAFFSLDNIEAPFGGAPLDRVTTATETVQLRMLGRNKAPTLTWIAVIFGTGNNIDLKGDMPPRVLIARQESAMEDPRTRTGFRHDNLPDWIRVNRPWLVPALLTIPRAYITAGRPNVGTKRWGSFEMWSQLIPPSIVFAGGPDPMSVRIMDIASVSDAHRHLAQLIENWPLLVQQVSDADMRHWKNAQTNEKTAGKPLPTPRWGLGAGEAIHELYENDGGATGNKFRPLREAIEALCCPKRVTGEIKPTSNALAGKLRSFKARVVGGKRFMSVTNSHTQTETWGIEFADGSLNAAGGNVVALPPPAVIRTT